MPTKTSKSSVEKSNGHRSNGHEESFESIQQIEVPKGRDGKHKRIVTRLLEDIDSLKPETALKVPLSALPDTKENIRSALNRATRQRGVEVATSSDAEYLYIWKVVPKS
jgi:hypothetical protein